MNRGTWIRKASPWSPNGCASLSENRIETRPAQYAEAPPAGNHVSRLLLAWYARGHRDLPWRHSRDPYAIWVSEIMLQQTRAQAVIPYYRRFLARFPTVAALAAAAEDDVLALWSGLGYYSRVRNLRRAAPRIATAGGPRARFREIAQQWMDPRQPGHFNQALMELGATVCLPRHPLCLVCPLA